MGGTGDRAETGGQGWMPEIEEILRRREAAEAMCAWVRDAYRVLPGLIGRPSFGTRP